MTVLPVELWYAQQPLTCETPNIQQDITWSIGQFAFFMSQLQIQDKQHLRPLKLQVNDWQTSELALLQFFSRECQSQVDSPLHNSKPANASHSGSQHNDDQHSDVQHTDIQHSDVQQTVSLRLHQQLELAEPLLVNEHSELTFELGVPFALNHLNPLTQPSPLNLPAMFWSWRAGYKFLRLDLFNANESWVFHLGSTGCVADSVMRSPKMACAEPNRLQFSLKPQRDGTALLVHLDRLLAGVKLEGRQSCLLQPEQQSCQILLNNLANGQVFEWR
ncbi:MAG: metallo-mystery pair system four-Cys motif protein [Paraglaciecola sp.]|nr:metallo-mystery pair system four-Cys motif protein [Paraglaciecola sp.]NCT48135.1 metallo-mystery pair system four-Cys motif protein [Paraglaciecola sp.]